MHPYLDEFAHIHFDEVKSDGDGFKTRCTLPGHNHGDKDPSLAIYMGKDQSGTPCVKLHCRSAHEDMKSGDLFDAFNIPRHLAYPPEFRRVGPTSPSGKPNPTRTSAPKQVDEAMVFTYNPALFRYGGTREMPPIRNRALLIGRHIYTGTPIEPGFLKLRFADPSKDTTTKPGKRIEPWTWVEGRGWYNGRGDFPRMIYRQDTLMNAAQDKTIYLVEGEKCVDCLFGPLGEYAFCGDDASHWHEEYTAVIKAAAPKEVLILPDADAPGEAYAQHAAQSLTYAGISVRILHLKDEWPDLPPGGDIADIAFDAGALDDMDVERQREGRRTILKRLEDLYTRTPIWTAPSEPIALSSEDGGENTAESVSPIDSIDLPTLMALNLPPLTFFVSGLITQGLTLLVSPPKYGKSWMAWDLSISISTGRHFMGRETQQAGVLYAALEDGQRRLQNRAKKLLDGANPPPGCYLTTHLCTLDNGLIDQLEDFMHKHSDVRVIILDTFQKVRGNGISSNNVYASDYKDIGTLKTFADTHGIALIVLHHLRKMGDDGDPFMRISGSNGLLGAADTAIVLTREKRKDSRTRMDCTGRDIEMLSEILEFNKDTCRWQTLGDADEFIEQTARAEYEEDPIRRTIVEEVATHGGCWETSAARLIEAVRSFMGESPTDDPKSMSTRIGKLEDDLREYDGILHDTERTSTVRKHIFYIDDQSSTADDSEEEPL